MTTVTGQRLGDTGSIHRQGKNCSFAIVFRLIPSTSLPITCSQSSSVRYADKNIQVTNKDYFVRTLEYITSMSSNFNTSFTMLISTMKSLASHGYKKKSCFTKETYNFRTYIHYAQTIQPTTKLFVNLYSNSKFVMAIRNATPSVCKPIYSGARLAIQLIHHPCQTCMLGF